MRTSPGTRPPPGKRAISRPSLGETATNYPARGENFEIGAVNFLPVGKQVSLTVSALLFVDSTLMTWRRAFLGRLPTLDRRISARERPEVRKSLPEAIRRAKSTVEREPQLPPSPWAHGNCGMSPEEKAGAAAPALQGAPRTRKITCVCKGRGHDARATIGSGRCKKSPAIRSLFSRTQRTGVSAVPLSLRAGKR